MRRISSGLIKLAVVPAIDLMDSESMEVTRRELKYDER